MDESLHVLLHGRARRGRNLVVLNLDGARRHLVQTLDDNPQGLAEFLHTAEVPVVAVPVDPDGDIEIDLVVGIVGLRLADIPRHTGTTEHDTAETHVQGIGCVHDTNALGTGLPDPVVREKFLDFVDPVSELSGPLVDVVQQTKGNILRDTTRTNVSGVKTSTRNTLVEFLHNGSVKKTVLIPFSSKHSREHPP